MRSIGGGVVVIAQEALQKRWLDEESTLAATPRYSPSRNAISLRTTSTRVIQKAMFGMRNATCVQVKLVSKLFENVRFLTDGMQSSMAYTEFVRATVNDHGCLAVMRKECPVKHHVHSSGTITPAGMTPKADKIIQEPTRVGNSNKPGEKHVTCARTLSRHDHNKHVPILLQLSELKRRRRPIGKLMKDMIEIYTRDAE